MSVTGYMYNINHTKKLGELELAAGLDGSQSWHNQFKHSAYVYIGGLHPGFTEGDVVIVFSQFGEIVDINLIRDRTTGKSKGFAYICFQDQRSTVLAVDNMNGYQLLNRTLRVDHVEKYKAPKRFDEEEKDEEGDPKLLEYKATGAEGQGYQVYNVLDQQQKISEVEGQKRKKPAAGPTKPEDEDEAWAKAFEDSLTMGPEEAFEKALKGKKALKKEKAELKKLKKQAKKLKMEAKKAKLEAQRKKQEKMKKQMAKKGAGASKTAKGSKAVKDEVKSEDSSDSSSSSGSSSSDSDSSAENEEQEVVEKQRKARRK